MLVLSEIQCAAAPVLSRLFRARHCLRMSCGEGWLWKRTVKMGVHLDGSIPGKFLPIEAARWKWSR